MVDSERAVAAKAVAAASSCLRSVSLRCFCGGDCISRDGFCSHDGVRSFLLGGHSDFLHPKKSAQGFLVGL